MNQDIPDSVSKAITSLNWYQSGSDESIIQWDGKLKPIKGWLAIPSESFWEIYKTNKAALNAIGVSLLKIKNGEWRAFRKNEIESISAKFKAVEMSRASDADIDIPKPDGLDYLPFQKAGIKAALHILGRL